jgi:hypothetical protein
MIREQFGKLYFLREFHKRSHLFISSGDEPLSVVAVRVSNPDCSPVRIHG